MCAYLWVQWTSFFSSLSGSDAECRLFVFPWCNFQLGKFPFIDSLHYQVDCAISLLSGKILKMGHCLLWALQRLIVASWLSHPITTCYSPFLCLSLMPPSYLACTKVRLPRKLFELLPSRRIGETWTPTFATMQNLNPGHHKKKKLKIRMAVISCDCIFIKSS